MSAGNYRLFELDKHAAAYAKYRPTYPEELFSIIFSYCEHDPEFTFKTALDIACGSGQSTRPLLSRFAEVVGQDISPAQVSQAKKLSAENNETEIEFSVASAEDLSPMGKSSLDLVTCAQSFHWFDFEKVYEETKNVLKPNGVLAVYGYGLIELGTDDATDTVHKFWKETLKAYWPSAREYVNQRYKGIELPFKDFQRFDDMVIRRRMPLSSLIGYLSSSSAYQKLLTEEPTSPVMEDLRKELITLYPEESEKEEDFFIDVHWRIFLLIGRNI